MEENNIKSGTSADTTPKNVDTIAPTTAPDDQAPIASQIAGDAPAAEEPGSEQVSPSLAAPPEPEPSPEPEPKPNPESGSADQTSTFSITPKKSGGSKLGLIIALAVVLLCGAAVAAYFAFSRPVDKNALVAEAIEKAIYAEVINFSGSFNTSESGTDVSVSFTGAIDSQNHAKLQLDVSVNQSPININLQGQAIVNNGDVYVKLDGINEALSSAFSAFPSEYLSEENSPISSITSLATKIDGEWIKVAAEDLKTYTGVDTTACTINSAAIRGDIVAAYKSNSFITIGDELGERDGSIGYRVSIDQNKSQAFSNALNSSSSVSNLTNCMEGSGLSVSSILDGSSSDTSAPNVNAEIWVNKDSHEITNLQLTTAVDNGSVILKLNAKSQGVIDVQIPSSYMAFSEVASEFQNIIMQFMPSYDYDLDIDQDLEFNDDDLEFNSDDIETLDCTPENGCAITL